MHSAGIMAYQNQLVGLNTVSLLVQAMFLCTLVYITVGVCGYTAFKER